MTALLSYEGDARRLLGAMKFRNRRSATAWLAAEMVSTLVERDFDCVTWVPSSAQGRKARGFEPSRLLAARVAVRLGLPCVRILRRDRDTAQSQRSKYERSAGPLLRPARIRPRVGRVLLVDDVCTTGASLATAAEQLRSLGVTVIHGVVAASTPQHRRIV